jgi:hypothetical protein
MHAETTTQRVKPHAVLLLLGLTVGFSILSALLFASLLVINLGHFAVAYELQKALFVIATALATAAEVLEVLLLIPLLRRAKTTLERVGLVAALIPLLNLLLLFVVLVFSLIWKTGPLKRQIRERGEVALKNAPQQLAQAPQRPHPAAPSSSQSASPAAIGNAAQQATTSATSSAAQEVVGAGSVGPAGIAAPTAAAAPAAQSALPTLLQTLMPTASPALLQSARRLIPVVMTTMALTTAVTATVAGSAIANAALGAAPTPIPTLSSVAQALTATPFATIPIASPTSEPSPTMTPSPTPTATRVPRPTPRPTSTPTIPPPPVNLLRNPGFTLPYPPADTGAHCTGPSAPPPFLESNSSAAANWTLYNNSTAVTSTTLVPSSRSPGKTMIHVCTSGSDNGLVQVFAAPTSGPTNARSSAWVFVAVGQVSMGTGNGGSTRLDVSSRTTGAWELLQANNGGSPANEIVLYGFGSQGADYYVDFVSVEPL